MIPGKCKFKCLYFMRKSGKSAIKDVHFCDMVALYGRGCLVLVNCLLLSTCAALYYYFQDAKSCAVCDYLSSWMSGAHPTTCTLHVYLIKRAMHM